MSFRYRSTLMAQALSVIAEAGIHGMKYDGLTDAMIAKGSERQSKRARVSFVPAHKFTGREFEDYLILAWRAGLIQRSKYKEVEWISGLSKSSYELGEEIVRLTKEGWEFVEQNDRTLIERWFQTLVERVPFVLLSVVTAALTTWAISSWSASTREEKSPVHTVKSE